MRKPTRPRTRTRPSDWWVASVTARAARLPWAIGPRDPQADSVPWLAFRRPVRITETPKCASDPHVVSALRYGSKSERGLSLDPTSASRACGRPSRWSSLALRGLSGSSQKRKRASAVARTAAAKSEFPTTGRPMVGRSTVGTTATVALRFRRRVGRRVMRRVVEGVEGGTAPRQPRSGTREAWPQGVGWLNDETSVRRAYGLRCGSSGSPCRVGLFDSSRGRPGYARGPRRRTRAPSAGPPPSFRSGERRSA